MKLDYFITLPFGYAREAPPFEGNDICYPPSVVRHFLKIFTKKGDKVLDPFAGLGTTLFVAEDMGRVPFGIEAERERFEWTAGQMKNWQNIRHEDAANVALLDLPKMDFCITSPPFMPRDHDWNPLYSGNKAYAGYDKYLSRMKYIFSELPKVMKRGSYLVVHLDNLRRRSFTPLVWDVGNAIGASFRLENDILVVYEDAPKEFPYTHCLVFKKV